MSKTPVSILQEMMVKKCMVPNYELIFNGGGSHLNTFTYQVSCNGLKANGTGRCKKDAKHEAAKAMLETIAKVNSYPQLPASPAQSPVHTPPPAEIPVAAKTPGNEPFINAIGALQVKSLRFQSLKSILNCFLFFFCIQQEICADNNLQEPRYESVSDIGPPHDRVFTIHCIVSTFKEEGVAKTKKQAKHEAAKKMLDRITDVVAGKMQDLGIYVKREAVMHDLETNEIAKTRYPDLTKLPVIKKPNLGVTISEYHKKIKDTVEEDVRIDVIKKLNNLINDAKLKSNSDATYETLCSKFRELLTPLNIGLEEICLSTISGSGSIIGISLDTSPALIEMSYAEDKNNARIAAIIKVMTALHTMLL